MRIPARNLVCLGLFALLALLTFNVAAQTDPSAGSTIRGRAIYDDTEHPVRRAQVQLYSPDLPYQSRATVTDGSGEFVIKNVQAGEYVIAVGFPGGTNGFMERDKEGRRSVTVTVDGSANKDVKVRVMRGAAITGKITYPDGEPVIGAQLNLFVRNGKQWTHSPLSSAGASTDDRGIYRLYPLLAGEYIVSVVEQSLIVEERDGGIMQTVGNKSLTPYFYQDAMNLRTARILKLAESEELTNINLTLVERSTYRVGGTVTLRGKPLAHAYVKLDARDEVTSGPTLDRPWGLFVQTNKDGEWVFNDVPDGNYEVVLDNMRGSFSSTTMSTTEFIMEDTTSTGEVIVEKTPVFVNQRKQVTVAGADVMGVPIALSDGGRISGRVVVEGDKPLPSVLTITAEPVKSKSETVYTMMESKSKGLFLLEAVVPGENFLKTQRTGQDYFVRSMTWKGRDLLTQPIPVEEGKEITGVTIVLSTEVGRLTGQILDSSNKKPLARRPYFLVPADESSPIRIDALVSGVTDLEGKFSISGPPGEYIFITVPNKPNWPSAPEDLRKLDPQAPHVTLKLNNQNPVEILARVNP